MNAETQSTALTVIERAQVALGAAEHEKKLVALAKQSTEIVAITNPAGYQQLHAARMVLKNERVSMEKLGKSARDDAVKFSKAVLTEEARLIAIIEPEERRLQTIQDAYDNRVAAEKAAKEQAERERVEKIQAMIDEIKTADANMTITDGSELIGITLQRAKDTVIDARFQEFLPLAELAKVQVVGRLTKMHAGAVEYEAALEQARKDREELARRQAEEDARQKAAAEKEAAEIRARAEADAKRRAEIDAEERAARMRIEAQARAAQAEIDKAAKEAQERQHVEDVRQQAERARLAEQARVLETAALVAREEADAKARAQREADEEVARRAREEKEAIDRKYRLEQEERDREAKRKEQEQMDARQMALSFVARFGHLPEWKRACKAIDAALQASAKPKNGAPAPKTAATQESHAERLATGDSAIMQSPATAAAPANPDKPGDWPFPPQTTTTTEAQ